MRLSRNLTTGFQTLNKFVMNFLTLVRGKKLPMYSKKLYTQTEAFSCQSDCLYSPGFTFKHIFATVGLEIIGS